MIKWKMLYKGICFTRERKREHLGECISTEYEPELIIMYAYFWGGPNYSYWSDLCNISLGKDGENNIIEEKAMQSDVTKEVKSRTLP